MFGVYGRLLDLIPVPGFNGRLSCRLKQFQVLWVKQLLGLQKIPNKHNLCSNWKMMEDVFFYTIARQWDMQSFCKWKAREGNHWRKHPSLLLKTYPYLVNKKTNIMQKPVFFLRFWEYINTSTFWKPIAFCFQRFKRAASLPPTEASGRTRPPQSCDVARPLLVGGPPGMAFWTKKGKVQYDCYMPGASTFSMFKTAWRCWGLVSLTKSTIYCRNQRKNPGSSPLWALPRLAVPFASLAPPGRTVTPSAKENTTFHWFFWGAKHGGPGVATGFLFFCFLVEMGVRCCNVLVCADWLNKMKCFLCGPWGSMFTIPVLPCFRMPIKHCYCRQGVWDCS